MSRAIANGTPEVNGTGPASGVESRVLRHVLEVQEESLQLADSLERVVDLLRRAAASVPEVGVGEILLVENGEPRTVATFGGANGNGTHSPAPRALEIAGLARRALRERERVQQSGLSGGTLVAVPLRSPQGIEGVVVAAGDLDALSRFMAHAGPAIARERTRARAARGRTELERGARSFERTGEILDALAAREETELLAQRIVCAAAGDATISAVSLWAFRTEDGAPVEIARAGAAGHPVRGRHALLGEAATASEFDAWVVRLPRWGTLPWTAPVDATRTLPEAGDFLVAPLADDDAAGSSRGFLLAEVGASLLDVGVAEDLARWSAFARLAILQSTGLRRTQGRIEELRAQMDHEADVHRMKSRIIAAVSHELRTPLTSISAYAETLQKTSVAAHAETRARFLRIIHDESRRLTRIVDDILDLATLESGRVRLALRRVDLAEILQSAVDVIRPIANERGIEVQFPAPPEIPTEGDSDLLEQLVVNLLENAVKFSSAGGRIRVSAAREATSCRITVEDDGPGIPAGELDRIFEQFHQVDGSNTRRHGGAGLGLAICKSIALWHDGRIWAESEMGHGARFIVSLPRARAVVAEAGDSKSPGPTKVSATRKIVELLVEWVAEILEVETVALLRKHEGGDELALQATLGLPDNEIRAARERFTDGAAIRIQGETVGILHASVRRDGAKLDADDRLLLALLAERIALVLGKLGDPQSAADAAKQLERALRGVLDARRHTGSPDTSRVVLALCARLDVSPEDAARIRYAALVRDVGMVRVSFGVTRKPTPLDSRERTLVQTHPEEGARLLRPIELEQDIFDLVLSHHEEPAGSGYPRGMSAESIPLGAKILAVVDAYEALRAGRPYRPAVGYDEALQELRRCAGRQFDSGVVEALAASRAVLVDARPKRARWEASSIETPSSLRDETS